MTDSLESLAAGRSMEGFGGWLLVYVIGSVPVTLFYATGVAARFFDYHLGVVAGVFLVLATPLVLVVLKLASAPEWNIVSLWVGAGTISLIVITGALSADEARLREVGLGSNRLPFDSMGRGLDDLLP